MTSGGGRLQKMPLRLKLRPSDSARGALEEEGALPQILQRHYSFGAFSAGSRRGGRKLKPPSKLKSYKEDCALLPD